MLYHSAIQGVRPVSNFAVWIRMMRYLTSYRRWAITAFLGILANIALMITIPTILRKVIDVGIENKDSDFMFKAGLLIVGLGVLRGISGFVYRFFGERLSHYIAYDVRNQVYDKVQNLPFSYHDTAQTGTLITRAISDVDEMQRYFAFGMIDGVNTALLVFGVGVVMVITSPVLAILALAPLIPLAFYSKNFAQKVDPLWKKIMERLQKLGNHIQENSLGAEVIRAFNRETYEVNKFAENNENLYFERIDLIREWGKFIPISGFIVAISSALVLVIGAVMERNQVGGVTIGIIVSFNAYVLLVAQPLRLLGFVILLFTQATSSATRVFEIIDTPVDLQSKPDATELERIDGYVRMDNVSFAYSVDAPPILKDISFEAKPDQVVALLGPTGSGKSTLVNLIPRYYDVTEGQITIDGYDVRDVELSSLRRRIGMVLQSSLLFSATVRENIAYGSPDVTDEAVIAAAKAANAHEFIEGFPEGYETLIGERGVSPCPSSAARGCDCFYTFVHSGQTP
jgi:ATP-binding cassette subfamily B protein